MNPQPRTINQEPATAPALTVEGVSKRYRKGTVGYRTLREDLYTLTGRLLDFGAEKKRDADAQHMWALRDVSFEVRPGERVGIIGRNGSGKTTLLRLLAGVTRPTRGQITVRGRMGVLIEIMAGFHPELTGRENIYLNGAIMGMSRREIAAKFDEIVAFSEIEDWIDTPIKRYSSGMHVRLGFAVAAHLDPDILLVDEVLAVGDAQFQQKCLGKMEGAAQEGRTVVFVSHNMAAVERLCRWGLLLEAGSAVFHGEIGRAVEEYLSSTGGRQYGVADLSNHPQRTYGTMPLAKSVGLRVAGDPGGYRSEVSTGDTLLFEIQYDCGDRDIDLVQIGVCSLTGQRVFTVGTHHSPGFDKRLTGRGTIECCLPCVKLAEGDYTVTVMLGKLRPFPPHNLDVVENALHFRVRADDPFGTGHGVLPGQGHVVQKSEWAVR